VSPKQLYLVIRLPRSSSTNVSLLNSSSTYIPLLSNSSTSVPLLEVVVHLYHYKPRSSTGVLATIIGRALSLCIISNPLVFIIEYLYSLKTRWIHIIYSYTKQRRKPNQQEKNKCFDSLTIYCITSNHSLL